MRPTIEDLAVALYKVYNSHRAVQAALAKRGHRVELTLVMLWLDLLSEAQYSKFAYSVR